MAHNHCDNEGRTLDYTITVYASHFTVDGKAAGNDYVKALKIRATCGFPTGYNEWNHNKATLEVIKEAYIEGFMECIYKQWGFGTTRTQLKRNKVTNHQSAKREDVEIVILGS